MSIKAAFLSLILLSTGAPCFAQTTTVDECIGKVKMEGSFLAGRIFKAETFLPNTTQPDVMKRVAKSLLKGGLTISTMDKEMGLITASYSKKAVGGKAPVTTTISVVLEPKNKGVEGSATLSTPAGITTDETATKKDLCDLLLQ